MWQERILVVSDDDVSNPKLKAVLETEGLVEVADTVEHALNDLDNDYCAAIVVNADSAGIDIVDLYGRAVGLYPNIKSRFIFVMARKNPKHLAFFEKNGLRYIKEIGELKDAAMKILSR